MFLPWTLLVGCGLSADQATPAAARNEGLSASIQASDAGQETPTVRLATMLAPTDTPAAAPSTSLRRNADSASAATPLLVPTRTATRTTVVEPTRPPTPTQGLVAVVAPAPTPAADSTSQQLLDRGLQLYQQWYCGICHQLDVAETRGTFGPSHNSMGATAGQRIRDPKYTGSAKTAAEYIHESIINPTIYVVEGYQQTSHRMPAYNQLSQTDLDALVQMLLQQK